MNVSKGDRVALRMTMYRNAENVPSLPVAAIARIHISLSFRTIPTPAKGLAPSARMPLFGAGHGRRGTGALPHFHVIMAAVQYAEILKVAADEIDVIEENIFEGRVPKGAIFKERTRHAAAGYGGIHKNCFSPGIIENFTFMQEIFPSDIRVADNEIERVHA